jgi:hypothetical protein
MNPSFLQATGMVSYSLSVLLSTLKLLVIGYSFNILYIVIILASFLFFVFSFWFLTSSINSKSDFFNTFHIVKKEN